MEARNKRKGERGRRREKTAESSRGKTGLQSHSPAMHFPQWPLPPNSHLVCTPIQNEPTDEVMKLAPLIQSPLYSVSSWRSSLPYIEPLGGTIFNLNSYKPSQWLLLHFPELNSRYMQGSFHFSQNCSRTRSDSYQLIRSRRRLPWGAPGTFSL